MHVCYACAHHTRVTSCVRSGASTCTHTSRTRTSSTCTRTSHTYNTYMLLHCSLKVYHKCITCACTDTLPKTNKKVQDARTCSSCHSRLPGWCCRRHISRPKIVCRLRRWTGIPACMRVGWEYMLNAISTLGETFLYVCIREYITRVCVCVCVCIAEELAERTRSSGTTCVQWAVTCMYVSVCRRKETWRMLNKLELAHVFAKTFRDNQLCMCTAVNSPKGFCVCVCVCVCGIRWQGTWAKPIAIHLDIQRYCTYIHIQCAQACFCAGFAFERFLFKYMHFLIYIYIYIYIYIAHIHILVCTHTHFSYVCVSHTHSRMCVYVCMYTYAKGCCTRCVCAFAVRAHVARLLAILRLWGKHICYYYVGIFINLYMSQNVCIWPQGISDKWPWSKAVI